MYRPSSSNNAEAAPSDWGIKRGLLAAKRLNAAKDITKIAVTDAILRCLLPDEVGLLVEEKNVGDALLLIPIISIS